MTPIEEAMMKGMRSKRTTRDGDTLVSTGIGMAAAAVAIAAAALVAPPAAAPALADQADFQWRGQVAAGERVEIIGVNGPIEAVPATGGEVDVRAVKRGRESDPASVDIEVVEHQSGVTICAVYPTGPDRRPNECRPGGDGSDVRDNDVTVEFTVAVPAGVDFTGRTTNGDVDVGELTGDVRAQTVNGDVEIDGAARADGSTVNGSIRAAFTRGEWSEPVRFHTVNGGVTLVLPDPTNADIDIRTVNGRIESDFPLMTSGRIDRRRLSGSIGDGGARLEIATVNGSVRLRRGS